ncbi:MAG: hypothetical protein ACM3ML_08920 [Micromonosporaceae bacterium]
MRDFCRDAGSPGASDEPVAIRDPVRIAVPDTARVTNAVSDAIGVAFRNAVGAAVRDAIHVALGFTTGVAVTNAVRLPAGDTLRVAGTLRADVTICAGHGIGSGRCGERG